MMMTMTGAELKCALAIARETFGWHRQQQEISLSRLMQLTGLSRQSVVTGIEDGIKRGIVGRVKEGQGYVYSLSVSPELVKKLDQLEQEEELPEEEPASLKIRPVASPESRLVQNLDQSKNLTSTSLETRPEVVKKLDQPIKDYKETKQRSKKEDRRVLPASAKPEKKINPLVEPFFGEFCAAYSETYDGAPYVSCDGDFVQLTALRKRWATVETSFETAWARALPNYLATPQKKHTLADLCVHFATFFKNAVDRFGIPIGAGNGQRIVGAAAPVAGKYSSVGTRPDTSKAR
jgi:phage replication O-like protein O